MRTWLRRVRTEFTRIAPKSQRIARVLQEIKSSIESREMTISWMISRRSPVKLVASSSCLSRRSIFHGYSSRNSVSALGLCLHKLEFTGYQKPPSNIASTRCCAWRTCRAGSAAGYIRNTATTNTCSYPALALLLIWFNHHRQCRNVCQLRNPRTT